MGPLEGYSPQNWGKIGNWDMCKRAEYLEMGSFVEYAVEGLADRIDGGRAEDNWDFRIGCWLKAEDGNHGWDDLKKGKEKVMVNYLMVMVECLECDAV